MDKWVISFSVTNKKGYIDNEGNPTITIENAMTFASEKDADAAIEVFQFDYERKLSVEKLVEIEGDNENTNIIIIGDEETQDLRLTQEDARFFALAFRVKSNKGACEAPGDFCAYCPVKKCSRAEAIEYMKEYL